VKRLVFVLITILLSFQAFGYTSYCVSLQSNQSVNACFKQNIQMRVQQISVILKKFNDHPKITQAQQAGLLKTQTIFENTVDKACEDNNCVEGALIERIYYLNKAYEELSQQ